jgi:hypothetical protein
MSREPVVIVQEDSSRGQSWRLSREVKVLNTNNVRCYKHSQRNRVIVSHAGWLLRFESVVMIMKGSFLDKDGCHGQAGGRLYLSDKGTIDLQHRSFKRRLMSWARGATVMTVKRGDSHDVLAGEGCLVLSQLSR